METPSDDEIRAAVQAILAKTDLATSTERQIRKQAAAELNADLSSGDKKQIVRGEVESFLERQNVPDQTDEKIEGASAAAVAGLSSGGFGAVGLSDEMQEFLGDGTTSLARSQLVKRIWEHIKANNLQDPKNKRNIILDEKLSKLFQPPMNMFSMNKQISKHCWTIELTAEEKRAAKAARAAALAAMTPEERAAMEAEKQEKKAARKRKSAGLDENGEPKKRGGGLNKELRITPELAQWVGRDSISRAELTKFFWNYVKEKDLKNPDNKREIIADDSLRRLTGEESFLGFSFMKYLNSHLDSQSGPATAATQDCQQPVEAEEGTMTAQSQEGQSSVKQGDVPAVKIEEASAVNSEKVGAVLDDPETGHVIKEEAAPGVKAEANGIKSEEDAPCHTSEQEGIHHALQ